MVNILIKSRRSAATIVVLIALVVLGVALTTPAAAQTQGSGGFGVGSGDGLEVGIRLSVLNQVKEDIARGVYDRACTEAEHDPTKWHSMVNTQAKCHYNHHHGDDPNYVNDIFGEPGAWFQSSGQSISYPWQTFPATTRNEGNEAYQDGRMENQAKHEGYYWIVRRDQPCNVSGGEYCVKDFRVQFHGMFLGPGDVSARWHSMSAELRACRNVNDISTCGIVRTGGWMDHGRLMIPANNSTACGVVNGLQHIPLPSDTQYYPFQTNSNPLDEQRCHPVLTPQMIAAGPQTGRVTVKSEWWVHGASDFRFQLQIANPIGNIQETSPGSGQLQNILYCKFTDPECDWNQSIMTMRIQYTLNLNSYYVGDFVSNGKAMLPLGRRYISRFGGINNSCTAPGLDCIPIEYNNLPLSVSFGQGAPRFSHTPCENCQKVDYDLSPAGKQWLTWFYYKYGHATPTQPEPEPEPSPSPEPDPTGPAIYFQVDDQTEGKVNVNVRLLDVSNVFGIQTECKVNPQVLQGAGLVEGDGFNQGNSFIIDDGFQTDGVWRVGTSRLKPNPAITGTAVAYTLSYNVAGEGEGQLECSALAVDENGVPITLEVVNGAVMILPEPGEPQPTTEPQLPVATEEPPVVVEIGTISGLVAYQNRPNNSGIKVKLLGVANEVITEVTTNEDGAYTFPELPIGDYTLAIVAPQHIAVLKPVVIEAPNSTVQLNDQLRAGDVDDSGVVDMVDITLVGANFGLETIPEIGNVDLNADGWVNVSDLSLAGGNLDLASPSIP